MTRSLRYRPSLDELTTEKEDIAVPRGDRRSEAYRRRGSGSSIGHTGGPAGRRIRKLLEEQKVTGRIVQLVYDTYGPGALSEAWDEYLCLDSESGSVPPLELTAGSPFLEHFTSWLAHTWMPAMVPEKFKESIPSDEVPARTFLAQHPDLDPLLVEYLNACIQAPFSFFEVLRVDLGQRFTCRDLISGTKYMVFDPVIAALLRVHQILYARIVEVDGMPVIEAAAPWPLPEGLRPAILAFREVILEHPSAGARPAHARQCLLARERDLRSFYWGFIEEALREDSLRPRPS